MANPNNGPIAVSAPGSTLVNASGVGVTFNTRYPFDKLDSTLNESFQIITVFMAVDTPTPDGSIVKYNRTLIYSFAHGYKYVPAPWFLVSLNNFSSTTIGTEGVVLTVNNPDPTVSSGILVINVDSTNVNIYIDKYYNSSVIGAVPPVTIGLFISIRSYIFVNDLAGNDVPSQP